MGEDREPRAILDQAKEATDLARDAFAMGDLVTGIAALQMAAQLVQIARILPPRPVRDA
jgi:hypothetical protein